MDRSIQCQLEVPAEAKGTRITVYCSRVGEDRYRLEDIPVFFKSIGYQDVFEADRVGDVLRVKKIVTRGGWISYSFMVNRSYRESVKLRAILTKVEALGGVWERVFGGCLFICMPVNATYNPTADVLGYWPPPRGWGERVGRVLRGWGVGLGGVLGGGG